MPHHNTFLEQRREAIQERREEREERREERREEHEEHRFGRFGDRGEHQRGIHGLAERIGLGEDRGEHLRETRGDRLHEDRGELLRERREEHLRPQNYDQDMPHYTPPPGPPPGGYNRADFVSDDDFQRMMRSGKFENDSIRPAANSGYQPSYQQPPSQASYQRYPEPPLPSVAHEQRPTGSGYESGAYSQPHNSYAPPAGPPGAYSSHAPAGGFNSPPGPPPRSNPSYGSGTSQVEGRGRGAASEYYNESPPGQQVPPHSHTQNPAAAHGDSSNPAHNQQYNEAAQCQSYQAQQHYPSGEFDEQKYSSHFAAHAQAYGSDPDGKPMANDDIGTAAAVEALKITAANNQQSNARPQQGGRPQGGFQSATNIPQDRPSGAQQSGRPSDGKPHGRPQSDDDEDEDEEQAAKPQAPTGSSPQDKIVALAMAQAGKLFDKKGGGDNQGKTQAMQVAAATAMRMMTEYKSTGKVNMQPGEMQKLMGLAMSLF